MIQKGTQTSKKPANKKLYVQHVKGTHHSRVGPLTVDCFSNSLNQNLVQLLRCVRVVFGQQTYQTPYVTAHLPSPLVQVEVDKFPYEALTRQQQNKSERNEDL